MHRKLKSLILCTLLFLPGPSPLPAEQPAGAEAKLREALRSTMLQLRDVQTQLATTQAAQTEAEEKGRGLEEKLKALTRTADTERLQSQKTVEMMRDAMSAKDAEIAQLKELVEKAKVMIEQKEKLFAGSEEKRRKFEEKSILLDRRVAEQQAKNTAMHRLGLEILGRYEKFGLGDAITAREPFIGTTRVKFQNLVQDFSDKLAEQKIKPAPARADAPAKTQQAAREGGAQGGKKASATSQRQRD